ncbi:MAG: hypothetical protein HUJ76_11750, partial [Parasporobacterium sp.]|nr:hypothetical protein [Parasporobacterium sp.]
LVDLPVDYEFSMKVSQAKELAEDYNLHLPLKVLLPDDTTKRRTEFILSRQRPISLPPRSFIELTPAYGFKDQTFDRVLIASPEYCFLQAAEEMDIRELALLGTELCSIYENDMLSFMNHRRRAPICSISSLTRYLETANGIRGIEKARTALKYITERSNSYRESIIAVMFNLPVSKGGYNMPGFKMNVRPKHIPDNIKAQENDVVWDEEKVIVEYDSNQGHLDETRHDKDVERNNILVNCGYDCIMLTNSIIRNIPIRDQAFLEIRMRLKRWNNKRDLDLHLKKRIELDRMFRDFRKKWNIDFDAEKSKKLKERIEAEGAEARMYRQYK